MEFIFLTLGNLGQLTLNFTLSARWMCRWNAQACHARWGLSKVCGGDVRNIKLWRAGEAAWTVFHIRRSEDVLHVQIYQGKAHFYTEKTLWRRLMDENQVTCIVKETKTESFLEVFKVIYSSLYNSGLHNEIGGCYLMLCRRYTQKIHQHKVIHI